MRPIHTGLQMKPLCAALAGVLAIVVPALLPARSATIEHQSVHVVTNCADSGVGSLRDAVAHSLSGDTIDLSQLPCSNSTITLTSGAIAVAFDSLVFSGAPVTRQPARDPAAPDGQGLGDAIIDGNGSGRIFDHTGTGTVVLVDVTLRHGLAQGPGGCLRSAGDVVLMTSVISGCTAHGVNIGEAHGGGLFVTGDLHMTLSRVSGNAASGDSFVEGGGIFVAGSLTMTTSTVADNTAIASGAFGFGGGLYAGGSVSISYSTISGNSATNIGGADLLGADGSASLSIVNSTISGNTGGTTGGLLALQAPLHMASSTIAFNIATAAGGIGGLAIGNPATLQSTLIARNVSPAGPSDIAAQCGIGTCSLAVEGANNLFMSTTLSIPADTLTADPMLAPLANHGGPTMTHALTVGSPAIDHGNNLGVGAGALTSDQRWIEYARVVGASADIGAFEYGSGPDRIFTNGFDVEAL